MVNMISADRLVKLINLKDYKKKETHKKSINKKSKNNDTYFTSILLGWCGSIY